MLIFAVTIDGMVIDISDPADVDTAVILSNRTGGASPGNGISLTFAYGATVVPIRGNLVVWLYVGPAGLDTCCTAAAGIVSGNGEFSS